MAHAVRVAATFAVSWRSHARQTSGTTEDRARRADAHDHRVAEPFCAGRSKLRVPAVDHFLEKSGEQEPQEHVLYASKRGNEGGLIVAIALEYVNIPQEMLFSLFGALLVF